MKFKYLRSLEALFEATPQAVLQLVYMMRTEQFSESNINFIYILSISQSLLSMCKSILNADNGYMNHSKWKSYKKTFPIPSIDFIKHALFRLIEITYRVGLFAVFWTVVGGEYFALLLSIESLYPITRLLKQYINDSFKFQVSSLQELFLALNLLVSLPPEWIFEETYKLGWEFELGMNTFVGNIVIFPIVMTITFIQTHCCHPLPCDLFDNNNNNNNISNGHGDHDDHDHDANDKYNRYSKYRYFYFSSARILVSFVEWVIIILVGIYIETENNYLLSRKHCLDFFIVSICCFGIYALFYPFLMPDIRLPQNVSIRSKFGYAYLGNIVELERLLNTQCNKLITSFINDYKSDINEQFVKEFENELNEIYYDIYQIKTKTNYNIPNENELKLLKDQVSTLQEEIKKKELLQAASIQKREQKIRQKVALQKFEDVSKAEEEKRVATEKLHEEILQRYENEFKENSANVDIETLELTDEEKEREKKIEDNYKSALEQADFNESIAIEQNSGNRQECGDRIRLQCQKLYNISCGKCTIVGPWCKGQGKGRGEKFQCGKYNCNCNCCDCNCCNCNCDQSIPLECCLTKKQIVERKENRINTRKRIQKHMKRISELKEKYKNFHSKIIEKVKEINNNNNEIIMQYVANEIQKYWDGCLQCAKIDEKQNKKAIQWLIANGCIE